MPTNYSEDQTFHQVNFTEDPLSKGEYENCIFQTCDFSHADLSEIKFSNCEFIGCNLSLAKLNETAFRDVQFNECKMLGLHFENCNQFGLSFNLRECNLSHSSSYQVKMKKKLIVNCNFQEVDFTESDFSSTVFDHCDFSRAIFQNTILEKADFRTSINFSIHPENNRIRKARFSLSGISGLLTHYDIVIDQ